MTPTPAALAIVPRALAAAPVDRAVANAPLDDDDAIVLLEVAQREAIGDRCPACRVLQAEHWRCACCSARGHHIPRSHVMPDYCEWCVAEGCAQKRERRPRWRKEAA